jgi:hypothetical protein
MIITPEIDPIFVINRKSPGSHLGGERPVELPHFTRIGIDCKKKKRGLILSEGEIDRILPSSLSRTRMDSPANGIFHGDAEITEGKGNSLVKRGAKENGDEDRDEERTHYTNNDLDPGLR